MENEPKIAIIIPAYKGRFLGETLESVSRQKGLDFTVYIGDDASPCDIRETVDSFRNSLKIVYKRFDSNLGSADLVGHWERCVRMSNEPWVWLFSDDDIMADDCLTRLSDAIAMNPSERFFRFRMQVVDTECDTLLYSGPFGSSRTSAEDFLYDYLTGSRFSAACEYVFHRSLFESSGMVHLPVAWCSDVATWFDYALSAGGVCNIPGKPVLWRNAVGYNISSSEAHTAEKARALALFLEWLSDKPSVTGDSRFKSALRMFIETNLDVSFKRNFSNRELKELLTVFSRTSLLRAMKLYVKYYKFSNYSGTPAIGNNP